jgi:murein hydrolase activator
MMSSRTATHRRRLRMWIAGCTASFMVASVGNASADILAQDAGTTLAGVLSRELGLTRSATELRRATRTLEQAESSTRYTAAVLEHAGREGRRRSLSYQGAEHRRDAVARHRVRTLYKLAHGGAARLIFEGDETTRVARVMRARVLKRVVQHELQELSVYRAARERATAELVSAAREARALSAVAHVRPMHEHVLSIASQEMASALAAAQREGARATGRITPSSRRAHAQLLDELRRARNELRDADRGAPTLVRPVPGPVVGRFGAYVDPRLKLPMSRDGVELSAPPRAEVRAMAAGRVALVAPMPGFEEVIAIDHGDGRFSLTGRLWQVTVEEGASVEAGEVIGRVAPKAEDDDGLGSTVYVELRHAERPVDPAPLLKAR